jgi:glutamine cyclotransferase
LEFVNGLIYANIWTSNEIAVIDPLSGKYLR